VTAIKKHGQRDVTYVADRETLPEFLAGICKPDDIMLTLGAGNIWQAGEGLLKRLQA
jgi:UDP-N-acetylmuramate--alanine ligase